MNVMDPSQRIECALASALDSLAAPHSPPRLLAAMNYAVFPAGGRIRPRLCLAVARACGDDAPALADASAAAVELLHCASLVHDDLPCFDDAAVRRGRPSVHRAFGEPLAVLAGDALIVLAFEAIVRAAGSTPGQDPGQGRLPRLVSAIARGVGGARGIIAGQAWESEPRVPLAIYHRAKTGALFEAAALAGAFAAGGDGAAWSRFGQRLGVAYQVADDIGDASGDPDAIGKPVGVDAALGRPSAVRSFGARGAESRLRRLLLEAGEAVPPCCCEADLKAWIAHVTERLLGAPAEPRKATG